MDVETWAVSSAGRAPVLHAGGQRFDSATVHHVKDESHFREVFLHFDFVMVFYGSPSFNFFNVLSLLSRCYIMTQMSFANFFD